MQKFNGVEDTLFIPLQGRITGSKLYSEYFYDAKALELEKYLPSDSIEDNTNEYYTLASIARYTEFDEIIKEFFKKHPDGSLVNLGCGLDTTYFRCNNDKGSFYEIDMPKVVEQRRLVFGDIKNEILIGSDLTDFTWMDRIDNTKPTLFLASGVFQYFHHEDVEKLLLALKNKFKDGEIIFDVTNKTGLKRSNKYVKSTGNSNALMYFYIDKPEDFAKLLNMKLLSVRGFFSLALKKLKKKLKLSTKIICYFGDKGGYTRILHLAFN